MAAQGSWQQARLDLQRGRSGTEVAQQVNDRLVVLPREHPAAAPHPGTSGIAQLGHLPAGLLQQPRTQHSATLLSDGQVLVVGGSSERSRLASVERYDPLSNTWSRLPALAQGRVGHTATLLASGQVLVAGGSGLQGDLATAERWDPASAAWTPVAPMSEPRMYHTATNLGADGKDDRIKILVAGGGAGVMAIPAALSTGLASSLGCVGNRIYTALADEEFYSVIRADKLAPLAQEISTITAANVMLTQYHRDRQAGLIA